MKSLSRVRLFTALWTVAYQAPPSMAFSRHEYWSGLPFPSPGDLPDPAIKPRSPVLEADTLTSETPGKTGSVTKSCPNLATLWTEEPDRLQSMGFSKQEYWSGLPFPSPKINYTSI